MEGILGSKQLDGMLDMIDMIQRMISALPWSSYSMSLECWHVNVLQRYSEQFSITYDNPLLYAL